MNAMSHQPNPAATTVGAASPAAADQRPPARRWPSYILRRHGLMLLQSPLSLVGFLLLMFGGGAGITLIPTLIGIPLLVGMIVLARGYGGFQLQVVNAITGTSTPAPPPPTQQTWWRPAAVWERVKDPTAWRAIVFHLAAFPLATVGFWLTAGTWFVLLAVVFWPLQDDMQEFELGPVEPWLLERVGDGALFDAAVMLLLAVIAVVAGAAATGTAWVFERLARALLGPTGGQRVRQLEQQRDAAVDAADEQRRQTERNLHDGAQVHLTSLAMELGEVKEALSRGSDPADVADRVNTAHEHAKVALDDVRSLARGLHPAILSDRGLEPALSSLVARTAVPTDLHVDLPAHPPAALESLVYFTVAEALTNVAHHSGAGSAQVRVVASDGRLAAEVVDDGHGGADPTGGTGLDGLRSRADTVDGILTISSPPGGPTTVRLEVPWRS